MFYKLGSVFWNVVVLIWIPISYMIVWIMDRKCKNVPGGKGYPQKISDPEA